jgi:hypothetical protein
VFLAFLYYKNAQTNAAILVLVLGRGCSAEFDWICGMASGFMSEIFFVSSLICFEYKKFVFVLFSGGTLTILV